MTNTNDKIRVVYSDSDTLSSYMNRGMFEYFLQVFEQMDVEVIIPQTVKNELCCGRNHTLRRSLLIQAEHMNRIKIHDFQDGEPEADTYYELSQRMGAGEAAALAFAKNSKRRCVVASNNFRDVITYAKENSIELWPTTVIMTRAVEMEIISMERANILWKNMKKDGLKLPRYDSFEDYYIENKS